MSRILVYTSPARGHLFPMTALALELRARGHEVAVRTLACDVDLVRAQGLEAAPVDPRVEAIAGDGRGVGAELRAGPGASRSRSSMRW